VGLYDREYYRNDAAGFGRWAQPHRMWQWLIVINVVVFILQLATRTDPRSIEGPVTNWLELRPDLVLQGQLWRLLTSAFLHSQEWQHIVFNMLALWWFGRGVEEIYGSREFLAMYLVAAAFSGLAFCGSEWLAHPNNPAAAIGASGAVTAVLVIYAMYYPRQTILVFFIIPMPIIVFVILYVVSDAIGLLGGRHGSNVAFAAHLGGALFGFLYFRQKWRVLNWWPSRMSMRPRRHFRPSLRVYREPNDDDTALASGEPARPSELEEQLDTVLEKVARLGKSSLTPRENEILLRASEIYKQRRK
jgi:membrane associated rhomboid family serine protease